MTSYINRYRSKPFNSVALGVFALLLSFIVMRAVGLSMTHDESLTFIQYVDSDSLFSFASIQSNNHLLSSFFIKLSYAVFGNNPLAVRLPSIVAFVVYFLYAFKCTRFLESIWSSAILLVAMSFNPFVLDFFGLARGYGISMALETVGVFYLISYFDSDQGRNSRDRAAAVLFMFLGALAHLSLTFVFMAVCLVFVVEGFLRCGAKDWLRKNKAFLALSFLGTLALVLMLLVLKNRKDLYFGGTTSFYSDTVVSIIVASLYEHTQYLLAAKIFVLSSLALVAIVYGLVALRILKSPAFFVVASVLLVAVLGINASHYLAKGLFPIERGALFLLPVYFVVLALGLDALLRCNKQLIAVPAKVFVAASVLGFTYNLALNINTTHTLLWRYDASTDQAFSDVDAYCPRDSVGKVDLGINWLFEPTINFYRVKNHSGWLDRANRDGIRLGEAGCIYAFQDELKGKSLAGYVVLKEYPLSNSVLLKREN